MKEARVVSLLASGTEIVCSLGASELLVGRSHECDNPAWVTKLPACSAPAFDTSVSSGEIDAEVRRRLKAGEPLYNINVDLVNALKPSLVITQTHCDVCAVTPNDVIQQGCMVADATLALHGGTVQGIFDDIIAVGCALELDPAAKDLVTRLQDRINAVSDAVAQNRQPTVAVLEWIDPLFTTGNWGPELVEAANAKLVLSEKGEYSKTIAWDELREADPDFIIVAPCGFDLDRTIREIGPLERRPGWFELKAVRQGNVMLADGNKYFNRSGTTIADTVEILAEILHGAGGSYHRTAWRNYSELGEVAETLRRHADACAAAQSTYIDPATGYQVFTADFLRSRGTCCGKGCRHCPYSHALVKSS